MQNDLDTNHPELEIQILGVNDVGHELGNPTITEGRDIPWLQDVDDNGDNLSDIRFNLWDAGYRDVIILDKENVEVGRFNLTSHDLAVAENYNSLRQMLIFAASNSAESVGRLDTSLVLTPTALDANGEVNSAPEDTETLLEWQSFSYEIWVSTPESVNLGVTSASVVVAYDDALFSPESNFEFGPAFSTDPSSSIDELAGQITLSATASLEGAGANGFALLARITFNPVAEGPGAPIDLASSEYISPVASSWIELLENDSATVELSDIGSVDVEIGASTTTALYPVMYDLDDDGTVGFGDMSNLSSVFLSDADSSALAMKADFDHSGVVNFGDLSFFSANFLKSRASGETIVSPQSFPDQFVAAAAASASYAYASSQVSHVDRLGTAWPEGIAEETERAAVDRPIVLNSILESDRSISVRRANQRSEARTSGEGEKQGDRTQGSESIERDRFEVSLIDDYFRTLDARQ